MITSSGSGVVGREALVNVDWHISTRSHDNGMNCVEAGPLRDGSGRVAVRHSHHPDDSVIVYTRIEAAGGLSGRFITPVSAFAE